MNRMIRRAAVCLFVFVALGMFPAISGAQSTSVLGGTLTWSASSSWAPCGNGQFEITQFSNFNWQFGSKVYPVSGSAAYISNSPGGQCPNDGPQGGVGMSPLPAGVPFPVTCNFAWAPTSPTTGAVSAQSESQCGIFSNNTGPNPSTAVAFKNLQNLPTAQSSTYVWGDWTLCEGQCPYNGTNSGCCGTIANQISSPAMSGASLEIQNQSTTDNYDVMFTSNANSQLDWNLQACADGNTPPCTFQNFVDDVWFYVPSTSLNSIFNLEFDPDYTDTNNWVYKMSMECTSSQNVPANTWQFWYQPGDVNHPNGMWVSTGQSCANVWQSAGSWLHLQIYTTVNSTNHQYTYQAVGTAPENGNFTWITWSQNNLPMNQYAITAYHPTPLWTPDMFVETEIDNGAGTHQGTSTVYYDQYSMVAW